MTLTATPGVVDATWADISGANATLVPKLTLTFAVGDLLVLMVSSDNNATGGGPGTCIGSLTATGFDTPVKQQNAVFDAALAANGAELAIFTARCTSARIATDTVSIAFSPTPTAKCCVVWKISGSSETPGGVIYSGVGTGSNTGTPTVTTGSVPVGAVTIGMVALEGRLANHAVTGDADTTNGSWSTQLGTSAESGADASSMLIATQAKVQTTTTSTQTYDPTFAAADQITGWIIVVGTALRVARQSVRVLITPAVQLRVARQSVRAAFAVVNGNAAPTAIALSAVTPAPTATGVQNASTTPTAVALTAVTSAPTASGDSNTTPTAVALSAVTPTPAASGTGVGEAAPATAALVVTTPSPTASGNSNTTPTAIARTAVTPAPTASGPSATAPSSIDLVVDTPAPTATGGSFVNGTATPSAIARSATVPSPLASASHAFPATIAVSTTVRSAFATGTFPAGTYVPVGRVRLFDRTGTSLVATLESAFDIEWQDVDNGPGIGKFKLALNDPDSLLITLGQVVYCDLYDRSNVFSFIVEQYPQMRIQSQEELGQVMEISGRGSAAILDTALCYPFDGVNAIPVRSVRSFSFASQDYTETADWVPAVGIAKQGDMTTYWVMTLPETTHLTSAPGAWPFLPIIPWWIWSQDDNSEIGKSYFRETFTTADPANVEILATGDNYWTLYLDGVPILGDNEFQEAWQEHRSVSMLLPAGDHTVAAVVNNVYVAGLSAPANPAGFLMAITIPHEGQEVEPDLMLLSDPGWNALPYPATEPGFTPGGIVIALIAEAQTRSLLTLVTCGFTATHDSAGEVWETIPEFGINIGSSLLTTLDQLTSDGWIEWAMTPSAWVLHMWSPGNRGITSGVTFTEAINIGEATYEPAHTIVNRLLVSYGKGLFVVDDAGSQGTWGIHEGFLTLDTPDMVEATRLANKSIATSADDELAVTMRIEPDGASPDRPYVNFVVGDQVTGPSELGIARSYQVLGITITLDLMGDPEISLEMNRRVRDPEEVRVSLLQTLGSAVQGTAPGSRSVVFENDGPYFRTRTPTTGDVNAANPPTPGEVVFTVPGTVDTTGTSPRWVTPYRFLIYQVVMAVTTAGSGDITVSCLGDDFTLPAGDTSILINTALHRAGAETFTVSLTDVGGGDAEGLTVTLRYRYYTGTL